MPDNAKLSDVELKRYQRAILEIGREKQEKLKSKTVLQVGAGGLGSPLSLYLAASGVGRLIIYEMDTLDITNMGRQILYSSEDIGKKKAILAKKRLQQLNPDIEVIVKDERLTFDSVKEFIHDVDYLVDASDNFETKYLINDLSLKYNIPCTIAGIRGFDGQILSVIPHKTSCYRCCFGDPKTPPNDHKNAPLPVMAPTCGVVGSLEANEVIKGLLGIGQQITNGILMINLKDSEFTKIPIKINPNCLCQKQFT